MTPSCRFCYSYTPQTFNPPCCPPVVAADNITISTIASIPARVNNNIYNSDQALLMTKQKCFLQTLQTSTMMSTVQSTIANANAIQSTLYSQLLQVQSNRYTPYQPYIPPMIPSSVTQLLAIQANAGASIPQVTNCTNARGSQFVTK